MGGPRGGEGGVCGNQGGTGRPGGTGAPARTQPPSTSLPAGGCRAPPGPAASCRGCSVPPFAPRHISPGVSCNPHRSPPTPHPGGDLSLGVSPAIPLSPGVPGFGGIPCNPPAPGASSLGVPNHPCGGACFRGGVLANPSQGAEPPTGFPPSSGSCPRQWGGGTAPPRQRVWGSCQPRGGPGWDP